MTLDISQIVIHYRHRWQIETAFRDAKQNFGFDKYQVKSRKSINRFVQLSFVAACLTKLVFTDPQTESMKPEDVCQALGIHWYRPKRLTLGLCVAFLRSQITQTLFSASSKQKQTHRILHRIFRKSAIYTVIKLLESNNIVQTLVNLMSTIIYHKKPSMSNLGVL